QFVAEKVEEVGVGVKDFFFGKSGFIHPQRRSSPETRDTGSGLDPRNIRNKTSGQGGRCVAGGNILIPDPRMKDNLVEAIRIRMELIVTEFMYHVQKDQQTRGNTDAHAQNIDC